ncbi:MAG TPA: SUMF1/EgtB/PvdO family nonheme iron enzyme [Bryobacteraceae bacterium]|nr:SUMF1/EgtB/PvdO family nonheme iron enzyme [Bryobacteraceae bacterium]
MGMQKNLGLALQDARAHTDCLFGLVRPDSFYERPIPERHRIIFYVGHLEAFDWNLIGGYALGRRAFHAEFDRLFAFGIDPPPGQLPADQPADWPGVAEVERYRRLTREEIDAALEDVPERLLHVAIEHRLMHAETFAYILHQLAYERKRDGAQAKACACGAQAEACAYLVDVPAGEARLGLSSEDGFGWDNEFQEHRAHVPAFAIDRYKVTNGEYLEFVRQGAHAPFFWVERDGQWFYRGMFGEVPLPLDWPVYVTHAEAQAYAEWRGLRLPTEPEFHRAAEMARVSSNADFQNWDPMPVTADERPGDAGPQQMVGNGWEWTSTVFAPFQGFEPFPFYTNYSAPFFDGEHYVLKGASQRTAACMLRPSFRNWFRPSYPYIYATFRLVQR